MFTSIMCTLVAACGLMAAEADRSAVAEDRFIDLRRPPDGVTAITETGTFDLQPGDGRLWRGGGVEVATTLGVGGLHVELAAPDAAVKRLHLRWKAGLDPAWKYLGDAWERGYGDLHWGALDARRPMPWYFLAGNGTQTHGYGVMTGPAALCCWKADAEGISLWTDVRSGGVGVRLGSRRLAVCTVTCRRGKPGETPFSAARAFCRQMCPKPRLPKQPVYGFNDWYCYYGKDTAENFMRDAAAVVALAPQGGNRPFAVIDGGWQADGLGNVCGAGPWDRTNSRFGSTMEEMVKRIRGLGARPGVWYRPLLASPDQPPEWRLSRDRRRLDPTVPAVRRQIAADIARLRRWGFKLIKHDYSTFDLTGRWGFQMGDNVTDDGWAFADRSRTTAEVVLDVYRTIREAAGDDVLIIGCDTFSHLAAGIFELQRIGDDTSSKDWERTRKMGVNSLAFRAVQHGAFYAADADCMGMDDVATAPWAKNRQWLDLLARSGTPLFVSMRQSLLGDEQQRAIRAAFAVAARSQPLGEPLDWMDCLTPTRWRLMKEDVSFAW